VVLKVEDLEIYQMAEELADIILEIASTFAIMPGAL
jgi:hypothetical protein